MWLYTWTYYKVTFGLSSHLINVAIQVLSFVVIHIMFEASAVVFCCNVWLYQASALSLEFIFWSHSLGITLLRLITALAEQLVSVWIWNSKAKNRLNHLDFHTHWLNWTFFILLNNAFNFRIWCYTVLAYL